MKTKAAKNILLRGQRTKDNGKRWNVPNVNMTKTELDRTFTIAIRNVMARSLWKMNWKFLLIKNSLTR